MISAVLAEYFYQKLTHQKVTVGDWSAVVTGLLLAYNLPANAPVWLAVVGAVIAIVLVKQIFGGIGSNFMNPALAARAILFVSWATQMTTYPATRFMLDGVSTATPLNSLGTGSVAGVNLMDLFLGNIPGVLGETCKLALLLGGVYLILRRIVDWKIPVTFIATVFVCYLIKDGAEMALYQILSGGLFLGAFFMATDYATSPVTNPGRVIMGIGCGHFPVCDPRLCFLSGRMLLCHPADERGYAADRQVYHAQALWGGETACLTRRKRMPFRFS